MELKLVPKMFDALVSHLRSHIDEVRRHEREIMAVCVRQAGMPRRDFISTFPKNETNVRWIDKHVRAKRSTRPARPPQAKKWCGASRKLRALEEAPDALDPGDQGRSTATSRPAKRGAPREEGDGRGEPPPRDLDRQEVHEPRPAVPGPDPGRQHRPHEGGRQVRIPPRLQVLDLRDVVDPPGHHALDRRPGPHDPHPGAHDRDDQQAEPDLAADAAGDGSRADAGRTGAAAWRCPRTRCARC